MLLFFLFWRTAFCLKVCTPCVKLELFVQNSSHQQSGNMFSFYSPCILTLLSILSRNIRDCSYPSWFIYFKNIFRYISRAKRISNIIKDQPLSPQENVVFWTEYVVRHNGAKHLNSVATSIPTYQYLLLDVIGFILLATIAVMSSLYLSLKIIFHLLQKYFKHFEKGGKND